MREAGQADVAELTGLMREFYAESGLVLDERQAAENLRAMIRLARQRGMDVVLIAVPKPGSVKRKR